MAGCTSSCAGPCLCPRHVSLSTPTQTHALDATDDPTSTPDAQFDVAAIEGRSVGPPERVATVSPVSSAVWTVPSRRSRSSSPTLGYARSMLARCAGHDNPSSSASFTSDSAAAQSRLRQRDQAASGRRQSCLGCWKSPVAYSRGAAYRVVSLRFNQARRSVRRRVGVVVASRDGDGARRSGRRACSMKTHSAALQMTKHYR